MGLGHSPSIVTNGLVLCLDAGNTKSYPGSGTAWNDLSGRSNNGTLTNGPTYSSSNGGSIVFDGTDDVVDCGSISGSFASFSVLVWLYPTTVSDYRNVIDCNHGFYTSGNVGPRLEMDTLGKLEWIYSNNTTSNSSTYGHSVLTSGLTANVWHHASITYNGSNNTSLTYYNGELTANTRIFIGSPTGFVGSMNKIIIGRGWQPGQANRVFVGRVPQVLIYNRVLSAAEVAQNYTATRGRFGL